MKTIPYGQHWIDEEDIKEVLQVLRSSWITQGPKIREFEDALCKYTGAKYAVAVSSGTAALHIACLAAGIKPDDEVITSPITFVASANCVLYCGGKPVFVDVQEDTVNIDPEEIKKSLTKKTKAIIPVHFAGQPCDMEEIKAIAEDKNLIVIEDACHALGAEYKKTNIGSCAFSDMTVFSFHPVKHITTGEGGVVMTNNKDLYEKLSIFRNHGITKDDSQFTIHNSQLDGSWYYEMLELGFNYRITDFQCALGISQLKKLDNFVSKRIALVRKYNHKFAGLNGIKIPSERSYAKSSWHIYIIRIGESKKRKFIFEHLRKSGIGVQVHYIPVHLQPYYRERLGVEKGNYPKAERYYEEAITLPLYPLMDDSDVDFVVEKITEVL